MRGMKNLTMAARIAVALAWMSGLALAATAQTTAFSYQGELKDEGVGINADRARFVFQLWDSPVYGHQIGSDVELTNIVVTEGIFTVFLDFGESAFDGNVRYLRIGVNPTGGTSITWLSPRQPVTAAPFAIHALHGGDNPWTIDGNDISYVAGDVGIGTASPAYPLSVSSTRTDLRVISGVSSADDIASVGVWGEVAGPDGKGVFGKSSSLQGVTYGVHGEVSSADGYGVYGYNGNTSGATHGVVGRVRSGSGMGVYGKNSSPTGSSVGVYGETGSTTGFGGYFLGRGYFSDRVGIGMTSPSCELDVAGSVRMDGFRLDSAPQAGYILTSDAAGIGSWQPAPVGGESYWDALGGNIYYDGGSVGIGTAYPSAALDVIGTVEMSGFKLPASPQSGYVLTSDATGVGSWQPAPSGMTLPYQGSISSTGPAFAVTNTGTAMGTSAISGKITNANSSSDAAAGSFNADGSNGHAVVAFSDGSSTIYADHDGGSYAFSGSSTGAAAGYFYANGSGGHGVHAKATGEAGYGLHAEATGGGAAIVAEASLNSTIGLVAKGSSRAAKFYGNVAVYEYGTTNMVLELGKGLDYAEGFNVTEGESEDLPKGTVLVIDPTNPGHLTRCTQAYDRKVAGIVAGANGLGSGVRLGAGQFDHDVALAGRVYCNVVAFDEAIQPGDLLTTSSVAGYAMRVADPSRAPGAVLGKAMEPLAAGQRGQILVLVTLQ